MKHTFEKTLRITADLLTYCHKLGALDYHVDMKHQGPECHCTIRCTVPGLFEDSLSELRDELSRPRMQEIEQSYWGLSGEIESDSELTLVGMMVDEAEVVYEGEQLRIHYMRLE